MSIRFGRLRAVALCLVLCVPAQLHAVERSPIPMKRPFEIYIPKLRWDHLPKGQAWTQASMRAILSHGQKLPQTIPRDIQEWCPGYADQPPEKRAAFWAGLLSSLSFHESTWREDAVGGGGLWYGLVQIAPPTAEWRKCKVQSRAGLKVGTANLACAVRIMNITVPRDQVVSAGMRGVAADWGPFHSTKKRQDMQRWSKAQPYCKVNMTHSPYPQFRPVDDPVEVDAHVGEADEGASDFGSVSMSDASEISIQDIGAQQEEEQGDVQNAIAEQPEKNSISGDVDALTTLPTDTDN